MTIETLVRTSFAASGGRAWATDTLGGSVVTAVSINFSPNRIEPPKNLKIPTHLPRHLGRAIACDDLKAAVRTLLGCARIDFVVALIPIGREALAKTWTLVFNRGACAWTPKRPR